MERANTHRLSWREHGDALDVALLANRAARHGHPVCWCEQGEGEFEAGDYSIELPPKLATRLVHGGFTLHQAATPPVASKRLGHPATALLCGEVSAYPYFGFYTVCLLRLGLAYRPVSGVEIAAGALHGRNLLVLPGGFATWGLDEGEAAPGADAQVRRFMHGGGCIGSCGGAFYLSAGRPGWTATLHAVPRWTHEYLQSGAAVVTVALARDPLCTGLPASIELPYYHGPVYEEEDVLAAIEAAADNSVAIAGRFRAPCLPSRHMIDNPLDLERFQRSHAGRAAILRSDGLRGRAVLFSPHPEMGDLMRKYMALDGYVRHYLPVRGAKTMAQTLRFYRPLESPSFRLVNNAVHWLDTGPRAPARVDFPAPPAADVAALEDACLRHLHSRRKEPEAGMEALLALEHERIRHRLLGALSRLGDCQPSADEEIRGAFDHAAFEAMCMLERAESQGESARVLFDVDMVAAMAGATARVLEVDALLES